MKVFMQLNSDQQPQVTNIPRNLRRVYDPKTGEVYHGDPVDCKEMMEIHDYTVTPTDEALRYLQAKEIEGKPADVPVHTSTFEPADSSQQPKRNNRG